MRRRRRIPREIEFSFDSFLDVVANVVGTIIRLILVAWVGARSYKAVVPAIPLPPPTTLEISPLPDPTDPRVGQLALKQQQVHQERERENQGRAMRERSAGVARQLREDLNALLSRQQKFADDALRQLQENKARASSADRATMDLEQMRTRSQRLLADMELLKQQQPARKELRYRTPVSSPVQTEELMFECQQGRVSLIDTGALLAEVRREGRAKSEELRNRWQVSDVTAPVGSFRLRYTYERERSTLDGLANAGPIDGPFRYGLSGWEVVPVQTNRGESLEEALASESSFRRLADTIDPMQTVVTIWVYPDSFALYRGLRDYLHQRDIVVAGRPLPHGIPIASSRQGTTSRGQ